MKRSEWLAMSDMVIICEKRRDMMKRLSEFKSKDEDYTLLDMQRFRDQIKFEDHLSWYELQALIIDLMHSNELLIDYAARFERGGYGD